MVENIKSVVASRVNTSVNKQAQVNKTGGSATAAQRVGSTAHKKRSAPTETLEQTYEPPNHDPHAHKAALW